MYGHYIIFISRIKVFSIAMDSLSARLAVIFFNGSPTFMVFPKCRIDAAIENESAIYAQRRYIKMFGSSGCTYREWNLCSIAWRGDVAKHGGKWTFMMKAIVGSGECISHAHVG